MPTLNIKRTRQLLESFEFKQLFVEELGWARAKGRATTVEVEDVSYRLTPIAEQGGMVVYLCDGIPVINTRKKIDKRVSDISFEHLIIFVDEAKTKAVWLWVKKETGKPTKAREHTYVKGQAGDLLMQKLAGIVFEIDELDQDGQVPIVTVAKKVAKAFDVERVTKHFYDEFKDEHTAFIKFIKGIDESNDREWYTSVMLNRLMFIYFIQKKRFLDNDPDYLRHKLEQSQHTGKDRFYRYFLRVLFFEGFAQEEKERSSEVEKLLGKIPYLNGGLFLEHSLEVSCGDSIQIPDSVFERLFTFFDSYVWHLDDRPLRDDKEINPDVLGYIFEKYINQKQMGAYYTKEDITGYICRNTVLPFLVDKLDRLSDPNHALPIPDLDQYLRPSAKNAAPLPIDRIGEHLNPIAKQSAVFPLKTIDPYIYEAVKTADYLPTETEREYAARQKRLAQIRADFKAGKINSINDLITYNLNIERVIHDWLDNLSNPVTLRAFYFECLSKLTVLDPTVGSGAFLFAAMNILEPLYEKCLDKMVKYVSSKYADFEQELKRIQEHPNRRYFIFKSIIINNLFGVDIMEEATEICKLRLFLKLVSQVEDAASIEPLPDIDFNIRAGNTLVGYTSVEQIESASLFGYGAKDKIRQADIALRAFRDLQTKRGISARVLSKAKADTRKLLAEIEDELNKVLQQEYGVKKLESFVETHQPFHWYVEFNSIMQDGGFDVIVGNPPYVEYSKVKETYIVQDYKTENCGNLYVYVLERSRKLLNPVGRLGMIVPIAIVSVAETFSARKMILEDYRIGWFSNFAIRPAKLFEGVEQRLTIFLGVVDDSLDQNFYSTKYNQWYVDERPYLLARMEYANVTFLLSTISIPKTGNSLSTSILAKVKDSGSRIVAEYLVPNSKIKLYFHRTPGYWIRIMNFEPYFKSPTSNRSIHHIRELSFVDDTRAKFVGALVSSSLYFLWFFAAGNCRNLTLEDVKTFLVGSPLPETLRATGNLFEDLMADFNHNSFINRRGDTEFQEFNWGKSKPIIDKIDKVLAKHYGFTDEELDFIINYDIKYRMGREEEGEGE